MKRLLVYIISIALMVSCANSKDKKVSDLKAETPIEEFSDMKFGMFIHWGLYAIPGGIWEGEEIKGIGEWIMKRAEIPAAEYAELAKQFNPVKFNAEAWSQLAVDAGMKYLVITSKHHDGFAMYKSEASDYNIVDATPFNKDPMVSLSSESRKRGLKFGFYYSQAQDWYEPNAAGNTWDFPEERDPAPYLQQKVFPQVDELLKNYGNLGLIWFDTPQLLTKEQVESLYHRVKELQPGCLVNSRIGFGMGDYDQLGDNQVPVEVRAGGKVWEVPATLNETWGYKYNDHHWKDPEDLIFNLVDIISKGGNYLLNVGPDAEGVIPAESQEILLEMGEWVDLNQEAVYGTSHSPFYPKGVSWRCTTKPHVLYIHIVKPENEIQIDGFISKVKSAQILSTGVPIEFTQKKGKLILKLTDNQLRELTPVVKLSIEEEEVAVQKGFAWNDMQTEIEMPSRITRYCYEDLSYDIEEETTTGFFPTEQAWPSNQIWWNIKVRRDTTYGLYLEYYANEQTSGGEIQINAEVAEGNADIDKKYRTMAANYNAEIVDTEDTLLCQFLGEIDMTGSLNYRFKLSMDDSGKSAQARIKGLRLKIID